MDEEGSKRGWSSLNRIAALLTIFAFATGIYSVRDFFRSDPSAPVEPRRVVEKPVIPFVPRESELPAQKPPIRNPPERIEESELPRQPPTPLLAEVLQLEDFSAPERSGEPFPMSYLRSRILERLGQQRTTLHRVRVGVAFIEPRDLRRSATGGTIVGFLVVALPDIAGCASSLGGSRAYEYATPDLGLRRAIDDNASQISLWIFEATKDGKLRCPGQSLRG